jgi:predicted glycoside hydrolase/deacetylase ChbG (UPF0249 family)
MPWIRIVARGDDSGSCRSANRAIADAFKEGVLRNTSIMVPAPMFREAARMYKDLDGLCVGLHATITDEWNTHRWGPVLGAEKVPSLVMEDGTFFKSTQSLWDNKPNNDEIMAEIKAQLDLARSERLNMGYLDEHMAFGWFEGLLPRLHAFAEAEGLIHRPEELSRLPRVEGEFYDPVERLLASLEAAEPGKTYLLVAHPCYDDDEVKQMTYGAHLPGEIAKERDWQRLMFMSPRVLEYFGRNNIQPIRYTDLTVNSGNDGSIIPNGT